jgi:hypothetical protein
MAISATTPTKAISDQAKSNISAPRSPAGHQADQANDPSFSEEKEAKRLLSRFLGAAAPQALPNGQKNSFFQKRTSLPLCLSVIPSSRKAFPRKPRG